MVKQYKDNRKKRHLRVRAKIKGMASRPRLSVFRSNTHIYAQIIDDETGNTLVAFSDLNQQPASPSGGSTISNLPRRQAGQQSTKTETARLVGQELAKQAVKANIKTVVFDRGGYKYHGRVKALAEGAREGGLNF